MSSLVILVSSFSEVASAVAKKKCGFSNKMK